MAYKAGHGVEVSIQEDPVGAPADFSLVGELSADFDWPQLMRPRTEVLAHERHIDGSVFGVLKRGSLSLALSYDMDDPTHETLKQHLRYNVTFAVKIEHPPTTRTWICSGGLESIDYGDPIGEGVGTLTAVFWPSGNMLIDGEIWDGAPA